MSRTMRRTSDKKRFNSGRSHFVDDYIYDYEEKWEGRDGVVDAWRGKPSKKLTGKEYGRAYHKFHGDTNPGYGWGNYPYSRYHSHQVARAQNKNQIERYKKDPNHEVVICNVRCLSWDR